MPIEEQNAQIDLKQDAAHFTELRNANQLTLTLPKRNFKFLRIVGLVVMAVSSIPLFISYQFIAEPLQRFLEEEGSSRYFDLIFAIAGLIPASMGLLLFLLGFCLIFFKSQCRISIGEEKLSSREHLGPFRKTWSVPKHAIKSLQLIHAGSMTSNTNKQTSNTLYAIIAHVHGAQQSSTVKDMRFAPAYPLGMLQQITERISTEYRIPIEDGILAEAADSDPAQSASASTAAAEIVIPDQPSTSRIEFEDRPEGLAVRVPPKGLIKGSKGLIFFAVFWNLFVAAFYAMLIYAYFVEGDSEALAGMAFMLIFAAVGVGVGLAAINMGKRKADILVMRGGLTIKRSGVFGEKVLDYDLNAVERIICGPSGMSVNDVPVQELQIWNTEKKTLGLLSQLDNDELKWLAALLDRKLKSLK